MEWYGSPTERMQGELWGFFDRMDNCVGRLLVECCRANVQPRHPGLQAAFAVGREIVDNPELDEETLRTEIAGEVTEFVLGSVHSCRQVIRVIVEESGGRGSGISEYVSLWASDPSEVRQYLLDLLAPLEVQLDQFYFERGEPPPRGLIGK